MKIQNGKSILLQSSGISDPMTDNSASTEMWDIPGKTESTELIDDDKNNLGAGKAPGDSRFPRHLDEPVGKKTILVSETSVGTYCVGWLLVVSGPMKGNSYAINIGRNSVGRDSSNAVRLMSDESISREAQVYVIYDEDNNEYAITPGGGSAISRLNGQRLDTSAGLKHGDIITLSKKTNLRFIPACDEQFHWNIEQ